MKLINIRLTNFRKYESAETDLPDGLTGILGQNGTGKSTLMEAVGWALYGHPAARTGKEDIRRQGSAADDIARVELTFELSGTEYTVVREMRGKNLTADASVITGGEVIARGARPAQDYIERLLGMDRDSFFISFFARQKELNALSDYRPAERKSMIIRMLGIDDVDRAIELVKQDGRDQQSALAAMQLTQADPNQLESALAAAKSEEKTATGLLETARREADDFDKQIAAAQAAYAAQEHSKADNEQRERQRELAENNLTSLQSQAAEKQAEIDELTGKQTAIDAVTPALRFEAENEKALADEAAAEASKAMREAEALVNKVAAELGDAQKKQAAVEQSRKQDDDKIREFEEAGASLDQIGAGGVCPTCLQPLKDLGALREHRQKEIAAVRMRLEKADAEIAALAIQEEKLKERLEEIKNDLTAKRRAEASALDYTQRFKRLVDSLPESKTRQDTTFMTPGKPIDDRLQYLADRRDEVKRWQTLADQMPAVTAAFQEIKEKQAAARALIEQTAAQGPAFDPAAYASARDAFESMREEKYARQLAIKDLERTAALAAQQAAAIQKDIEAYEKVAAGIKDVKDKIEKLVSLAGLLKEFRLYLIGRIRPMLAEQAGMLLGDLTDGKYTELELDDDYEIFVTDNGQKFPVDRFSGGEKDLANLCLRLAISLTLADRAGSDYGFIVLDEIFGSQDNVRKMNIMRSLASLNKRFRQIFLITHVEDIKDEVENVITVTESEDGHSIAALV
jgi:exonuclease SbcC